MKNVKIKMSSTIDKSLYYPQGAFILGYKYDNDTTKVIFEIPIDYKQPNCVLWLTPPINSGITKQTPIPLINESEEDGKGLYSLLVSGDITQYVGEWKLVLVLQGNEVEDIPTCISNEMIGIVKDSNIDPENIEELPENSNIKILYNEMKALYDKLNETLLTADVETVQEIQEDLELIKSNLEDIISIDWASIQGLANIGEDIEELKNSILNINEKIGENEGDTLFLLLNEIVSKLDDIDFNDTNTKLDDLNTKLNEIDLKVNEVKTSNETINGNIVNLDNYIKTIIVNSLNTINEKIPDISNLESEVLEIKNLIGYVNNELLNL